MICFCGIRARVKGESRTSSVPLQVAHYQVQGSGVVVRYPLTYSDYPITPSFNFVGNLNKNWQNLLSS